jgi:hypothetical protein
MSPRPAVPSIKRRATGKPIQQMTTRPSDTTRPIFVPGMSTVLKDLTGLRRSSSISYSCYAGTTLTIPSLLYGKEARNADHGFGLYQTSGFRPLGGTPHPRLQMSDKVDLHQDRRGLRFSFSASAEVSLEGSSESLRARVTELSLRGCFLEISGRFAEQQRLQVKIFNTKDFFEASAEVIYVRKSGVGVLFGDINPHFHQVLRKWVLAALDRQ